MIFNKKTSFLYIKEIIVLDIFILINILNNTFYVFTFTNISNIVFYIFDRSSISSILNFIYT